jgi:hypothetical protein
MPRVKTPKTQVTDYLSSTSTLIKVEGEDNLPLFIQFEFNPPQSPNQLETDEAEVILAYSDGFAVPANAEMLPQEWRITEVDPEGNALFKVPPKACVGFQHRKLRRRRYFDNVKFRRYAA